MAGVGERGIQALSMTDEERKEARRRTKRKYYDANKEKVLAYAAAYRAEHRDRIRADPRGKEWSKAYRLRHPERLKAMGAVWREKGAEQRKKYNAEYLKRFPERHCVNQQNRRARKAASGGKLSRDLATKLFDLQKGKCACCRASLDGGYEMDHIIPLAKGGLNIDSNIQLLTPTCNRRKSARDPVEYMQSRGMLL